ncbi:collagen alpha-6(VI) chain-like isoform X2 [Arapaima gigas]
MSRSTENFTPHQKNSAMTVTLGILAVVFFSSFFHGNNGATKVCSNRVAMDIVLLVGRLDMESNEVNVLKNSLCSVVDMFYLSDSQVQISLGGYVNDFNAIFKLNTSHNAEEIKSNIRATLEKLRRNKDHPIDFLLNEQFTEAAGSRAYKGVPQIVLTTSWSWLDGKSLYRELSKHGITVFTVIPPYQSRPQWIVKMGKDAPEISYPSNFSDLQTIFQNLSQVLCETVGEPALQAYPVCQQEAAADIVFLVDGSYSISPQQFTWIKDLLYVLVGQFYTDSAQIQFGLVQYSDNVVEEFGFRNYKTDIKSFIWNLKQINGTNTMTGLGLGFLLKHQFTEAAGSRIRQGVPQIGVVITGRRSADRVEEKAEELKKKGVTLYAIGRRDAAVEELRKVVSKPENMYFVSSFSRLHDITGDIIQSLCATAEEGRNLSVHLTPDFDNTETSVTVQRRRSLTIQCHYGEEYKDHVKYWCRMRTQSSCTTIVSTDVAERRGQVSIADDPTCHVFHITMRDLQTMDTDVYWCGVKTNNTELYMAPLNLTVTAGLVALSVENTMITADEGGNAIFRCFYHEGAKGKEKRWCRKGDWGSCLTAGENSTSQNRVHLGVRDSHRMFVVLVKKLERNDTGWYWIAAGDQYIEVYINVLPKYSLLKARNYTLHQGIIVLLNLTLGRVVLRRSTSSEEQKILILLHVATALVYVICTAVAAYKMQKYSMTHRVRPKKNWSYSLN